MLKCWINCNHTRVQVLVDFHICHAELQLNAGIRNNDHVWILWKCWMNRNCTHVTNNFIYQKKALHSCLCMPATKNIPKSFALRIPFAKFSTNRICKRIRMMEPVNFVWSKTILTSTIDWMTNDDAFFFYSSFVNSANKQKKSQTKEAYFTVGNIFRLWLKEFR